ncbi:MAG: CBS and ACT domain-containing protein [Rhodothermales bacterium]
MRIQDIMHYPVVTAEPDMLLTAAYRLMQEHDIRHLPVLKNDRLVGIVTDRDLRFLTRRLDTTPFNPEDRVDHLMTAYPITAGPFDPVEEAARLMRERKIGCLPILDRDTLVGIVTVTDLLDAIIDLTGAEKPSGRLSIALDDTPGLIARVTAFMAEHNVHIHSVLTYPGEDKTRLILRVGTLNTHALADALREKGFDVIWPTQMPDV